MAMARGFPAVDDYCGLRRSAAFPPNFDDQNLTDAQKELFDTISSIFTNVDPAFLLEEVGKNPSPDRLADRLATGGYPKIHAQLKRIYAQSIRDPYLDKEKFSPIQFFSIVPKPEETFTDVSTPVSPLYVQHTRIALLNEFTAIPSEKIDAILEESRNHYLPALRRTRRHALDLEPSFLENHESLRHRLRRRRHAENDVRWRVELRERVERRVRRDFAEIETMDANDMPESEMEPATREAYRLSRELDIQDIVEEEMADQLLLHGREQHIIKLDRQQLPWPVRVDHGFFREYQYAQNEDAVRDELNRMRQTGKKKRSRQKELICGCCFVEYESVDNVHCGNGTEHSFCSNCFRNQAENCFSFGREEIECLESGCDHLFDEMFLKRFLPAESLEKREKFLQQTMIKEIVNTLAAGEELVECPFCPFAAVMLPNSEGQSDPDHQVFQCQNMKCLEQSCRVCHREAHPDLSCDRASQQDRMSRLRNFVMDRMSEKLKRRCPNEKCGTFVIKMDGCNHMTCGRCRTEFCYMCGVRFSSTLDFETHFIHGDPRIAMRASTSDQPPAQCMMITSLERVHVVPVEEEAKKAYEEFLEQNPEFRQGESEEDLKKILDELIKGVRKGSRRNTNRHEEDDRLRTDELMDDELMVAFRRARELAGLPLPPHHQPVPPQPPLFFARDQLGQGDGDERWLSSVRSRGIGAQRPRETEDMDLQSTSDRRMRRRMESYPNRPENVSDLEEEAPRFFRTFHDYTTDDDWDMPDPRPRRERRQGERPIYLFGSVPRRTRHILRPNNLVTDDEPSIEPSAEDWDEQMPNASGAGTFVRSTQNQRSVQRIWDQTENRPLPPGQHVLGQGTETFQGLLSQQFPGIREETYRVSEPSRGQLDLSFEFELPHAENNTRRYRRRTERIPDRNQEVTGWGWFGRGQNARHGANSGWTDDIDFLSYRHGEENPAQDDRNMETVNTAASALASTNASEGDREQSVRSFARRQNERMMFGESNSGVPSSQRNRDAQEWLAVDEYGMEAMWRPAPHAAQQASEDGVSIDEESDWAVRAASDWMESNAEIVAPPSPVSMGRGIRALLAERNQSVVGRGKGLPTGYRGRGGVGGDTSGEGSIGVSLGRGYESRRMLGRGRAEISGSQHVLNQVEVRGAHLDLGNGLSEARRREEDGRRTYTRENLLEILRSLPIPASGTGNREEPENFQMPNAMLEINRSNNQIQQDTPTTSSWNPPTGGDIASRSRLRAQAAVFVPGKVWEPQTGALNLNEVVNRYEQELMDCLSYLRRLLVAVYSQYGQLHPQQVAQLKRIFQLVEMQIKTILERNGHIFNVRREETSFLVRRSAEVLHLIGPQASRDEVSAINYRGDNARRAERLRFIYAEKDRVEPEEAKDWLEFWKNEDMDGGPVRNIEDAYADFNLILSCVESIGLELNEKSQQGAVLRVITS